MIESEIHSAGKVMKSGSGKGVCPETEKGMLGLGRNGNATLALYNPLVAEIARFLSRSSSYDIQTLKYSK